MFGCLLRRYESALDCCGGRGSGCSRPAMALLEEVAINPTIEPLELTKDREADSWRHKQNLVCTRTSDPQETDPDFL